jgi:hypothetical protein
MEPLLTPKEMEPPLFLNDEQIDELTGRKVRRLQCDALRLMGIPFHINMAGKPIVCRSALEGRPPAHNQKSQEWHPAVLRHGK